MKIGSITLKGFRCFGDTPTTVELSDGITAFVGTNGSGKTALLEAILRVFGILMFKYYYRLILQNIS